MTDMTDIEQLMKECVEIADGLYQRTTISICFGVLGPQVCVNQSCGQVTPTFENKSLKKALTDLRSYLALKKTKSEGEKDSVDFDEEREWHITGCD